MSDSADLAHPDRRDTLLDAVNAALQHGARPLTYPMLAPRASESALTT